MFNASLWEISPKLSLSFFQLTYNKLFVILINCEFNYNI